MTGYCNGILRYPENYEKKKITESIEAIRLLNWIFLENITQSNLNKKIIETKNIKVFKEEKSNGIIKVIRFKINDNYVRIELTIETIDSFIFRKALSLTTTTFGRCGESSFRVLDFKLLRDFLLNEVHFIIQVKDNNSIVATDFNESNLRLALQNYPDYKFGPCSKDFENEEWINRICYNQYNSDSSCCYSYIKANKDYIDLINNMKINIINDLLYSPNYIYSINAMEAIIYLNSINKITIDDAMKTRMESIKKAKYVITIQKSSDLYSTVNGYNELNTSDENVIKKYRNSLP